jgi:hypothetical protein
VPDNEALSPQTFDEVYAQVAGAALTNKLFDQVLGPFPQGVEPFLLAIGRKRSSAGASRPPPGSARTLSQLTVLYFESR